MSGASRFGDGFAEGLLGLTGAHGLVFLLNAGDGVEEELREVADGEGVAAVNALASELLDDVGEERVDAVGGVEIAGSLEKLSGERFGIGLGGLRLTEVIRAKRFVVDAKHAAMLAARTNVLALIGSDEFGGDFGGHENSFQKS
jgi:hypothetical protein